MSNRSTRIVHPTLTPAVRAAIEHRVVRLNEERDYLVDEVENLREEADELDAELCDVSMTLEDLNDVLKSGTDPADMPVAA